MTGLPKLAFSIFFANSFCKGTHGEGRHNMNIRFLIAWLALGLLAVGGCVGPKVQTDFDPSAEFSAYRTFAFKGLTDRDQNGVLDNSFVRKRIEVMVGQQLTAKGLRQVGLEDHSDLLVHFWIGVKDKQRVESTEGRYGWRDGYYGGNVTTYEYQEGTLIVDLVESSKKDLVWRAMIVETLRETLEKNAEVTNKGVATAFENYPPGKKEMRALPLSVARG
jgi:Domain of unknown function (DUF4136)